MADDPCADDQPAASDDENTELEIDYTGWNRPATTAATTCPVPLWPDGPECIEQAGHNGAHHGLTRNVEWAYTACWGSWQYDGVDYRCLAPMGHEGGHAGG